MMPNTFLVAALASLMLVTYSLPFHKTVLSQDMAKTESSRGGVSPYIIKCIITNRRIYNKRGLFEEMIMQRYIKAKIFVRKYKMHVGINYIKEVA